MPPLMKTWLARGMGRLAAIRMLSGRLSALRSVSLTGSESETLDGSASWGRFVQGFVNLTGSAGVRCWSEKIGARLVRPRPGR